ncbi:MAG: gamma-glutamylcyclotransferase [Gammaproteobacteria bacterium]
MSADKNNAPREGSALFAYGTLTFDEVMVAVLGRAGPALDATLEGFERRVIRGATYPGIAPRDGAEVRGRLWTGLSAAELARLDNFEGSMYRREAVVVRTADGPREAMAYVIRPPYRWMLTSHRWEPQTFRARSLAAYVERARDG